MPALKLEEKIIKHYLNNKVQRILEQYTPYPVQNVKCLPLKAAK